MNALSSTDPPLLSYTDHLPVAWTPLVQPLDTARLEAMAATNLQVLAAVAAIEERRGAPEDETPLAREIALLHHKVDLMLEVVAGLLRVQQPLPPGVSLRLSAQDLLWCGAGSEQIDGAGLLDIHLHRSIVQPLRLPARSAARDAEGLRLVFEFFDETSAAALERHVFLHHRRSVADARQAHKR